MKIKVYQATADIGYVAPHFADTDRASIEVVIATLCRDDWTSAVWEDGEPPPKMPESDRDVIRTYFDPRESSRTLTWHITELEIPDLTKMISLVKDYLKNNDARSREAVIWKIQEIETKSK